MLSFLKNKLIATDRKPMYDRQIVFLALTLICIGFIMIFSSSITQATNKFDEPFFYGKRDLMALLVALFCGFLVLFVPVEFYKKHDLKLLIFGIVCLLLVLLVGSEINKAKRWIKLGVMNVQPSEIMKLCWIVYLSSFLTRKREEVTKKLRAFVKQLALFGVIVALLLCQPDYGSSAVLFGIMLGLLFIGGANLLSYISGAVLMCVLMVVFAVFEPYRLIRLTTFLEGRVM